MENIQLAPGELEVLNKIVPTVSFSDHKRLMEAIRDAVTERNDNAPAIAKKNDMELKLEQTDYTKNIHIFLLNEAFYAEREGFVYFLTEKGKHLKQQGSLQNYYDWKEKRGVGLRKDLNTIRERGYLDQDEIVRNRRKETIYKIKKFVLYPLIGIIVLMLLVGVAHKNGLDKNIPALKNWLDNKGKRNNAEKEKDKDDDDDNKK